MQLRYLLAMQDVSIQKMLDGFKNFRIKYFYKLDFYQQLRTTGQSPLSLIITCSDSRVDPSILFESNPGEIFVVRNVANLVPPFEKGGGFHGVSAAIEFAVQGLKVKNIIVLGHRQCGGIRALMDSQNHDDSSFVSQWMNIASKAKERVLRDFPEVGFENQCRHCEEEAIKVSIENLRTFPFISNKETTGQVKIWGLYFDLEMGQLNMLSSQSKDFEKII